MSIERKSGLITDFDNTLVKTKDFILRHILHTCDRLKIQAPPQETLINILKKNPPFEEIFTSLFGNNGQNVLVAYREDAMETPYEAADGALELVDALQQGEALIVIVSNRTNKLAERLDQARFNPSHFLAVIQPTEPKPSKNAYKEALELLSKSGVRSEDVYVLGDSIDDYQACTEELQGKFFAVLTGPNTKDDFLANGIDENHLLGSLEEFLPYF